MVPTDPSTDTRRRPARRRRSSAACSARSQRGHSPGRCPTASSRRRESRSANERRTSPSSLPRQLSFERGPISLDDPRKSTATIAAGFPQFPHRLLMLLLGVRADLGILVLNYHDRTVHKFDDEVGKESPRRALSVWQVCGFSLCDVSLHFLIPSLLGGQRKFRHSFHSSFHFRRARPHRRRPQENRFIQSRPHRRRGCPCP